MGLVQIDVCLVFFRYRDDAFQIDNLAFHTVDAFHHHNNLVDDDDGSKVKRVPSTSNA